MHLTPSIIQDILELAIWRRNLIEASAFCSRKGIDTRKIEYKGLPLQDVTQPDINVSILAISQKLSTLPAELTSQYHLCFI